MQENKNIVLTELQSLKFKDTIEPRDLPLLQTELSLKFKKQPSRQTPKLVALSCNPLKEGLFNPDHTKMITFRIKTTT